MIGSGTNGVTQMKVGAIAKKGRQQIEMSEIGQAASMMYNTNY
jgi:hypothetical protein